MDGYDVQEKFCLWLCYRTGNGDCNWSTFWGSCLKSYIDLPGVITTKSSLAPVEVVVELLHPRRMHWHGRLEPNSGIKC